MSKELTLKIIGPVNSYKSTVASLVEQALSNYNCHVLPTNYNQAELKPTTLIKLLKDRPTIHIEIIQTNILPIRDETNQGEVVNPRYLRQLKDQLEIANTRNKDLQSALVEIHQQMTEIKDQASYVSFSVIEADNLMDSAQSIFSNIDDETNIIKDDLSALLDSTAKLING